MCGEIDENLSINADLLHQFQYLAAKQIGDVKAMPAPSPVNLDQPNGRATYMRQLFNHILADMAQQLQQAEDTEVVDTIASQAIALARLAGFVGGQLPPASDLYRATIDAVSAGHDDCRRMLKDGHHDHHHGHHHH